ncbi:hypothetical protein K488DRAFT_12158, partial [Vararia minispora EC-137]
YSPSESSDDLELERGLVIGLGLGLAAWGVLLTQTAHCLSILLQRHSRKRTPSFLLSYIALVLCLGSTAIFARLQQMLDAFVDNRNFPGGPLGYNSALSASPVSLIRAVCYTVLNWLNGVFLVHRLYLIWNRKLVVVALPAIIFLASTSLSVVFLYMTAHPGRILAHSTVNFGVVYVGLSVALGILVTSLIACRLLYMRHLVAQAAGYKYACAYMSAQSVLVESGAIYPVAAIVFLVGLALGDAVQFASDPGIAPLLIIARMASGKAFSEETV